MDHHYIRLHPVFPYTFNLLFVDILGAVCMKGEGSMGHAGWWWGGGGGGGLSCDLHGSEWCHDVT